MRRSSGTRPVDKAIRFIVPSSGEDSIEPVPNSQALTSPSPIRPTLKPVTTQNARGIVHQHLRSGHPIVPVPTFYLDSRHNASGRGTLLRAGVCSLRLWRRLRMLRAAAVFTLALLGVALFGRAILFLPTRRMKPATQPGAFQLHHLCRSGRWRRVGVLRLALCIQPLVNLRLYLPHRQRQEPAAACRSIWGGIVGKGWHSDWRKWARHMPERRGRDRDPS